MTPRAARWLTFPPIQGDRLDRGEPTTRRRATRIRGVRTSYGLELCGNHLHSPTPPNITVAVPGATPVIVIVRPTGVALPLRAGAKVTAID